MRCRACHAVYPRPFLLPDSSPYETLEAQDYFHDHDPAKKVASGRWIARRAFDLMGRRGRALEIGCGRGELLIGAREEGWEVEGIDATPWADVPGMRIELATVETARSLDEPERYDLIIMSAILEHLYDPVLVLRKAQRSLRCGGLLFVSVPNECSLWARTGNAYFRLRGRGWAVNLSPTFPPFHVVGFCPSSLRKVVAAAGLSVVEMRTKTWPNELACRPGPLAPLERLVNQVTASFGQKIGMGIGLDCWSRRT